VPPAPGSHPRSHHITPRLAVPVRCVESAPIIRWYPIFPASSARLEVPARGGTDAHLRRHVLDQDRTRIGPARWSSRGSTPPPGWPGASPPGADDYEGRRKFEESIGAKARPGKQVQARHGQTGRLDGDGNRAGTDQAQQVRRSGTQDPLPGTVELFDRFVPTGTGAAKGQWYYRMLSGYAHAKSWGDGLGCAAGGPFDGSRRTIAISQGQDRAAVGCTRLSVDTVERALDAYELLPR
jgi:hypothetical protein